MSIDHVTFHVPQDKFEEEIKFMEAAFAHIGFKEKLRPVPNVVGMGVQQPHYWIVSVKADGSAVTTEDISKGIVPHVAITVQDQGQVDQFHKAAIEFGAKDNGKPGRRDHYHPGYYGAFVISPGGVNVEAVLHGCPEAST